MSDTNIPGPFSKIKDTTTYTPTLKDSPLIQQKPPVSGPASIPSHPPATVGPPVPLSGAKDFGPQNISSYTKSFTKATPVPAFRAPGETGEAFIDAILPGMGSLVGGLGEEELLSQLIFGAGSVGGAPTMQSMEPDWISDPYYSPEFRNPYSSNWSAGRGGL